VKWEVGDEGDEGDGGAGEAGGEISNAQFPSSHSQF